MTRYRKMSGLHSNRAIRQTVSSALVISATSVVVLLMMFSQ
jgi:hypothetical protein